MKITRVSITGMHKVGQKSYDLSDMTYFVGPNGAGKSTILEAIQLALLGYIPGYAKTNESIMKHASGPVMAVVAELDSGVKITRTWSKTGSSVSAKTDVEGYNGEFSELLSQVELPIFNFNEFKSMTANKLKEWFISFLPSSSESVNLPQVLMDEANTRSIPYDELFNRTLDWIEAYQKQTSAIEVVKGLNTHLKEEQSFLKDRIAKLQGTLQSLVRYDDAEDLDEAEIDQQIKIQEDLEAKLIAYEAQERTLESLRANIENAKKSLPADCFENDNRVPDIQDKITKINKEIEVLTADYADIQSSLAELTHKRSMIPSAKPVCPYTDEECETASKLTEKFAKEAEELNKQIQFKKEESLECNPLKTDVMKGEVEHLTQQLNSIRQQYDRLASMEDQIPQGQLERPTVLSKEEVTSQLNETRQLKVKLLANQKYEQLSEQVTADKFQMENELEIIKLWIKLTDANGLQSKLMDKPFEDLASDMSKYLTTMFGTETEAKFNLVSKANTFSFGINREGSYIEFDYLSSGERCLFTLALIMCILDKSGSQIRTIIIDDILDHLDSDNAENLFKSLKQVKDIQFILAGVKECKDKKICQPV